MDGNIESKRSKRRVVTVCMRTTLWLVFGIGVVVAVAAGCGASSVDVRNKADAPIGASSIRHSGVTEALRVRSEAMEPTLQLGDTVVVHERTLMVGAIVAYHPPEGAGFRKCGPRPHFVTPGGAACDAPVPEETPIKLISRVVAGPGNEIYIRQGNVYRKTVGSHKFVAEPDAYVRACGASRECNFPNPIKIPPGYWFLMGDNRGIANDSRFWGPVPTAWIVGVVTAVHKRKGL